jgi:hypothetical protein
MLKLRGENTHQALERCYRLMSPNVGGKGDAILGSGGASSRIERQLDMALASRVLAFVDNRLPAAGARIIRFCYSTEDNYADYAALTLLCWQAVEPGLCGRSPSVRDGVSALRLLVPWEVRHRVFHSGDAHHSYSKLAELLGVNRSSFSRSYQIAWHDMVDVLLDTWAESTARIEVYVNDLVGEKYLDGKPLKINALGALSVCFQENVAKVA